jgi:hypothetical protein
MDEIYYDNQYQYNRNYGCRIHEIIYKGFKSLIIENEKIRCFILVDKGTDIIEFLYKPKDIDFMWKSPLDLYQPLKIPLTKENDSGGFLDFYLGGWHEMLPNIYLPSEYKGTNFGLHGEIATLPWKYEIIADSPEKIEIKFFLRMRRTPFYIEKYLKINSNCSFVEFEENIINEANEDFEFMWGHHPVFGKPFLSENCVISLPKNTIGKTLETDYSGNSPFDVNVEFEWPIISDKNGNEVNVSRIMKPETNISFNIYIKKINKGWYGITNTKLGIGFGLKWDIKIFKYLMLWLCYQGFYNYPFFGRTYNVGIEPWSAIPGNLDEVVKANKGIVLKPKEKISTEYSAIVYESSSTIDGFNSDNTVKKI